MKSLIQQERQIRLVLKPSKLDKEGIGVFTTKHGIFKGQIIPLFNKDDIRYVKNPIGKELNFCYHIGLLDNEADILSYHAPKSWNHVSYGYFVNHSKNPNVIYKLGEYVAAEDIEPHTELTLNYRECEPETEEEEKKELELFGSKDEMCDCGRPAGHPVRTYGQRTTPSKYIDDIEKLNEQE